MKTNIAHFDDKFDKFYSELEQKLKLEAIIYIEDKLKDDVPQVIDNLCSENIKLGLLSGDNLTRFI